MGHPTGRRSGFGRICGDFAGYFVGAGEAGYPAAMVSFERRKTRSSNRTEAVRLYLEANAARAGVKAAVLSDEDGLLIGGVGDVDLEILAAVGPVFVGGARLTPSIEQRIDEVVKNHDLYASSISIGDTKLVLTSLGARFPEQRRAERAFERILAA